LPSVIAISALSANKYEGDTGTTPFAFTVTRSGNATGTVVGQTGRSIRFIYLWADASDFSGATSGTLTWGPGDVNPKTITMNVIGDKIPESQGDEPFQIILSNPIGATISADTANGTIKEDDIPPTVDMQPLSVDNPEGNSGTTPFTFTVTRTRGPKLHVIGELVRSRFHASPWPMCWISADRRAALCRGLREIRSSRTITVNVVGDTVYESGGAAEYFDVYLQPNSGARIGASYVIATIEKR
jgi:hypothetical protein